MNACAAMEIQMEIRMDIVRRHQHTFDDQTRNIADKQLLKRFTDHSAAAASSWDVCVAPSTFFKYF
jgi:hypothetical protein